MVRAKILKFLNKKFVRFLIAGGINTAFSYAIFIVLIFLLGSKELALTLNLLIAIFFNYNMSARFVFHNRDMNWKQILKFYMVYFLTYPLNLLHLHITVDIWNWNVYFSQFVTLFYMPIINFLLQRKFVFRDITNSKRKG